MCTLHQCQQESESLLGILSLFNIRTFHNISSLRGMQDSSLLLKKGSRREVMLGRQEEIKPLGQPGPYMRFPFTSLSLHSLTENELSRLTAES